MIFRRRHLAALALLASAGLTFAQVGPIPGMGPLPFGGVTCSDTSLHTITASGAGSYVVPAGCGHVTPLAWGGGSAGSGWSGTSNGGNGGGFATNSAYVVTPGNTIYYSVAAAVTGTTGEGSAGNNSWFNISTNAQPSAIANGIYATGGFTSSVSTGGSYAPTGATGYSGGIGGVAATHPGGGGGGAGSAGNGGAGTAGGTAGSGGTPDGGPGGTGFLGGSGFGTAPGGAGGGANTTGAKGGNGAAGQVSYRFSAFLDLPPANDLVEAA